jgi:hypothetical protein
MFRHIGRVGAAVVGNGNLQLLAEPDIQCIKASAHKLNEFQLLGRAQGFATDHSRKEDNEISIVR